MDTKSSDLRVPSEEDAAAANNTTITWAREPDSTPALQAKKFHAERLCYSAVSGGFIREAIGSQPDAILIRYISTSVGGDRTNTIDRAPVHSRSFDPETKQYVRDQCHLTVTVAGRGMHIYIRPNNNQTGAEHYVTHVTAGRGRRIGANGVWPLQYHYSCGTRTDEL